MQNQSIGWIDTTHKKIDDRYVNFEGISNSDIRKIFGLGEKEKKHDKFKFH